MESFPYMNGFFEVKDFQRFRDKLKVWENSYIVFALILGPIFKWKHFNRPVHLSGHRKPIFLYFGAISLILIQSIWVNIKRETYSHLLQQPPAWSLVSDFKMCDR